MTIEIIIAIIFAAISAFITWLVIYFYYQKSLENQKIEFEKQITPLITEIKKASENNNQAINNNHLLLRDKRINDASVEFRKKGTPKYLIDTYQDLNDDQKAELFDTVLILVKGRKGKNNPYR